VLKGRRAATHWAVMDQLPSFGATPAAERYVFDGKVVTAAGVSAGIDMALALAARIAGPEIAQAIQLGIEYDPQPPFDCGSPTKAPSQIVEMVRATLRAGTEQAA
jgi:transcriptional regulator GlxA family with amidase domain